MLFRGQNQTFSKKLNSDIKQINFYLKIFCKGHPPSSDLRYGEEYSNSHSTLIFAARKGLIGIYTLYIPRYKTNV